MRGGKRRKKKCGGEARETVSLVGAVTHIC